MGVNAASFKNQNFTGRIINPYVNSDENEQIFSKLENKKQNESLADVSNNSEQKKVGFKEGLKLIGKGFVNKIKNMAQSIVKHPVKTLLAVGATSLLIAAAPMVGIASATVASAMALGFAAYAVGKTAIDVVETVKDNKAGKYDEVREDLQKIGGDGVDLALSLPFVPKALKQVTRFAKYGRGTVGLNTELISNLKNCRSIGDVQLEFAKANTLINYEMIGNEMGLAVKPKLVFKDMSTEQGIIGGAYEPTTGELQMNQNILTGKGKYMAKMGGIKDPEIIIRHELEHFRQFSDAARTENIGIQGLENTICEYYEGLADKISEASAEEMERLGISKNTIENMLHGDKSAFNREFYQKVIDEQGIIKAGTKEAEMSAKYLQGLREKINPNPESIAQFENTLKGIDSSASSYIAKQIKIAKAQLDFYKSNILEKEAYAAQDAYTASYLKWRPMYINNILMADALATDAKKKV